MESMTMIKKFEGLVGGRWTGVSFHQKTGRRIKAVDRPMQFCEAVKESSSGPLSLDRQWLSCPGARRSFGWGLNGDDEVVERLIGYMGVGSEAAREMVAAVPRMEKNNINGLIVGTYDSPEILVSYLQPEAAMRLVTLWQKHYKKELAFPISTIMSVCGSVAAGSYIRKGVCCSFGCPESRSLGDIGKDRLVIGIPVEMAMDLIK